MKRDNISCEFINKLMNFFTDEGDHPFFETLIKKKSTFIILLKAQKFESNEDMIIAFVSFTKIKKNNERAF